MFQSNAAKEVLYIFLWLIGIIFFYGLIHTFLLEPSKNAISTSHVKHITSKDISQEILATSTSVVQMPVVTKVKRVEQKVKVTKTVKKEVHTVAKKVSEKKVPTLVVKKVPEKEKKKTLIYDSSSPHIKIPTVPTVTKASSQILLKVPEVATVKKVISPSTPKQNTSISVPTIPSVPSVPSALSVEN